MGRFEGNDLMATLASFVEPKAATKLSDFVAEYNTNSSYALPSQYEVMITSPDINPRLNRKVGLRCESIDLPGRSLNTSTDANMYGIAPEIVDGITFGGTLSMTFQSSADLEERIFFESWQERAWNRKTWNVGYYKDYVEEMQIYILDRNGNRRYGIQMFECFPKEIGPSSLSYGSGSEIIKIPITMQYKYWETLDTNRQIPIGDVFILDPQTRTGEVSLDRNQLDEG